jgi:RimJ/RimL family protein N-acetyltransferase
MVTRLKGKTILLRQISITDAEFTSKLRSDPRIFEFLSSNSPITVEEQREWIVSYLKENQGYYFVIENIQTGNPEGTISLYNFSDNKGEFGRYIALNPLSAVESEYLLIKFAFDMLDLRAIYARTADLNTKVWKQHESFGFKDEGFEIIEEKGLKLRRQILTRQGYTLFDYSKIVNVINRLVR